MPYNLKLIRMCLEILKENKLWNQIQIKTQIKISIILLIK